MCSTSRCLPAVKQFTQLNAQILNIFFNLFWMLLDDFFFQLNFIYQSFAIIFDWFGFDASWYKNALFWSQVRSVHFRSDQFSSDQFSSVQFRSVQFSSVQVRSDQYVSVDCWRCSCSAGLLPLVPLRGGEMLDVAAGGMSDDDWSGEVAVRWRREETRTRLGKKN